MSDPSSNTPLPELRSYQQRAIAELERESKMVLFPYGAGKSLIVLDTVESRHYGSGRRQAIDAIIVCKDHNELSWRNEIKKWIDDPIVFNDIDEADDWTRMKVPSAGGNDNIPMHEHVRILIARLGMIRTRQDQINFIIDHAKPHTIILDESTCIKSAKSKRSEAVIEMSRRMPPDARRIATTGNPMPEHHLECWAQAQFVRPFDNPFGRTYYQFLSRFFIKSRYNYSLRMDRSDEFSTIGQGIAVQFSDEEMYEHLNAIGNPEAIRIVEEYDITKRQRRLIDGLHETWSLPKDPSNNSNELSLDDEELYDHRMAVWHKERQLYGGFYLVDGEARIVETVPPKLGKLIDIIETLRDESWGRRIVVFYYYRNELELISRALRHIDVSHTTEVSESAMAFFAEQSPNAEPKVALVHISKSSGLNELVCADTLIMYSGTYSGEDRQQAEARLLRPGQKSPRVHIIDLVCKGSPDARIVDMINSKTCTSRIDTVVIDSLIEDHLPLPARLKGSPQ